MNKAKKAIVSTKPLLLILGYGYTAQYLTQKLLTTLDLQIIGTTRDVHAHPSSPIQLIHFQDPQLIQLIEQARYILISTPPNEQGQDPVLLHHYSSLNSLKPNLHWLGYLSATSVFGDHQGAWVTEQTQPQPVTTNGMQRLKAEQDWFRLAQKWQLPFHGFRLSGIYGPGRNALRRILDGKSFTIFKPGHVFSRIFVHDITQTLIQSMLQPTPMEFYHLADDYPCAASEVDDYACELLHRPTLPHYGWDEVQLSSMEQGFYATNKRISNQKIKQTFNINLQAPTYREGLNLLLPWENA